VARVKSLSVGKGDMFYIVHNSDNFTLIDCCMDDGERERIVNEIKHEKESKEIWRIISTHPDDDHIRGLKYLDEKLNILNFYCVNNDTKKKDTTDDFNHYVMLRDGAKSFFLYKGCKRCWLNDKDDTRGASGISIMWPKVDNSDYKQALIDAASGGDPNNISPVIEYNDDSAKYLWMGDMKTEFMEKVYKEIDVKDVTVLFAPHHGRKSGKVPSDFLKKLNPKIIVVGEAPSKDLEYYKEYNTIKQNSAGDIVFEYDDGWIDVYVGASGYSEGFLKKRQGKTNKFGNYIGSLIVKA